MAARAEAELTNAEMDGSTEDRSWCAALTWRDLNLSTGAVIPKPFCDFGRKRIAGLVGLANLNHFFRNLVAGASKSFWMLDTAKG